jgi:hypothetical protein
MICELAPGQDDIGRVGDDIGAVELERAAVHVVGAAGESAGAAVEVSERPAAVMMSSVLPVFTWKVPLLVTPLEFG